MAVSLKLGAWSKVLKDKLPSLSIDNFVRFVKVKPMQKSSHPELNISLSKILSSSQTSVVTAKNLANIIQSSFCPEYPFENLATDVKQNGEVQLRLQLCPTAFTQNVLQEVNQKQSFWLNNPSLPQGQTFVVEYSSPNIAKPFHVGHLRSTIIGNFISNLLIALDHRITRINYLGDWGTQFGLLKLGLDKNWCRADDIEKNPIQTLYQVYVRANAEAEKDPDFAQEARNVFSALEQGDTRVLEDWSKIRDYTVQELKTVYARLGVFFDEYHWESMYGIQDIQKVLNQLKEKQIVTPSEKGSWAAQVGQNKKIPIIKSDGSTLYITRDIAAALDRYQRYNYDRIIYVVDNAQTDHFMNLKEILRQMECPFWDKVQHVKFGRVQGMSTRKGTAIFLSDLLDEARERMKEAQSNSPTTKVGLVGDESSAEILGVSAVLVNDMKQRRQKDYTFNWEKILQAKGDSGIRLQYTHCRLCSLERKFDIKTTSEDVDPKILREKEALALLCDLARLDEVLLDCYEQLEPCILITYLFQLSHSISEALAVLPVRDQSPTTTVARYVLFTSARKVLGTGMTILGLKPLESM